MHAILATSLNIFDRDSFVETNRLMMAFPSVEDGHLMRELRYGIKTKLSNSTEDKGERFVPAAKEVLVKLFDEINFFQTSYNMNEDCPAFSFYI